MSDETKSGNSAGVDPALVDVQDPLPESNFFWRRVFAYVATAALLGLLAYVIFKMQQPESLRLAAYLLTGLVWFSITYYMIAPSAEQIVRIIQAARVLRAGIPISRKARAETADGAEVEVETTAGDVERDAAPSSRGI